VDKLGVCPTFQGVHLLRGPLPEWVDKPFQIRLPGTPLLTWQGQPYRLARRQTRALLYYLAHAGKAVARERLTCLLWPDAPEPEARRKLTRVLSQLHHDLPAADLLQVGGDYPAAIRAAHNYLTLDELAEEIHGRLIRLYAAAGNRAAALRHYESCTMVLERELGVEPLPETRAAYEAALQGERQAGGIHVVTPQSSVIPSLQLPLIGREAAA
jgi:DNA-binding SARP family transcriptional activator